MASLSKNYHQQKTLGQVYTPHFIVCKMLADIHFVGENVLGKSILDPACGDGRFLCEIAKRIIAVSPKDVLKQNLEHIYGWDIDNEAIELCLKNLNNLIETENITVNWNIKTLNSILKHKKTSLFSADEEPKFDVIVGNPPYIRIQHLDEGQRQYIQQNYEFCKSGSTDIYIAFVELCYHLLKEEGICTLITPNTYFYTETAKTLRGFLAQKRNILQITNYGDIQLFNNATTYSAIIIFNKQNTDYFTFQKAETETLFLEKRILFEELTGSTWQLGIAEKSLISGKKLGEIANIHVGITTLCDKAYIFTVSEFNENQVIAHTKLKKNIMLEKEILKPIIKASTLKNKEQEITEFVLFPYKKVNGKHQIIPEKELSEKYPCAYNYLLSIKEELDKRDNGKINTVAWYAFGRSQGLDTSFGKKILFSPMNNKPNFVLYENEHCTFYSGYCIKLNGYTQKVLPQLNSERMAQFMAVSSRDFRGGWKAYNKKIVEQFEIEM